MPVFRYLAYGSDGAFAEGAVEAATEDAAVDALGRQGLTPFELRAMGQTAAPWWNREIILGGGSRRADLVTFTRDFAMLEAADIPLDDALRLLQLQASSARLRSLVENLLSEVLGGSPLSAAMQKQSKLFPADYVAVVRAGEVGGTLADVFLELTELLERREEVHTRIQSALIYPSLLIALSLGTLAIIMGGLIPSLAPIFGQNGKPMPASIGVMLALRENWIAIASTGAAVGVMIAGAFVLAMRKLEMRQRLDRVKLQLPWLGQFLLQRETARFARTFGTMLKAGVPLSQAAKSSCSVVANRHIGAGIDRAIDAIHQGVALHQALRHEEILPAIALQMISVGEEAGKLDRMLTRIAMMFERQTQTSIDRFMSALTPALTVAVALLVGALILPVMTAVLSVNDLAAR
jgi:general secretion pathway protein F